MSRAPEPPADRPWSREDDSPLGCIVQVRGASGSGKSSLVRSVMSELGSPVKWYEKPRKAPIALTFHKPGRPLCVVGNYVEGVSTGGVDTITDKETPYRIARKAAMQGFDVLLEGIFISIEYWRTLYLHQHGFERYDVFIDLNVDECTEQVYRRQEDAGRERTPLKQMADFHSRVLHTRDRLIAAGVPEDTLHVYTSSALDVGKWTFEERCQLVRADALHKVQELLGVA